MIRLRLYFGAMARLHFLGAARTVTGSQYLLEAGDDRILIDSGMFQGEKELRLRNWAEPDFDPASVRALILTHTHLDHIGRVPRLVKQGFRGRVLCTPPTRELAEILLKDAAHLQQEDAAYFNRKGLTKHSPALPLFDDADVEEALKLFETVPLGETRALTLGRLLLLPRRRTSPGGRLRGHPDPGGWPRPPPPDERRRGPVRRRPHQGPRPGARRGLRGGREHLRQSHPPRRAHTRASSAASWSEPSRGAESSSFRPSPSGGRSR